MLKLVTHTQRRGMGVDGSSFPSSESSVHESLKLHLIVCLSRYGDMYAGVLFTVFNWFDGKDARLKSL